MYQSINVIPLNTNVLNENQKKVVLDLSISMNQSANNLLKLLEAFNNTTNTVGILNLIYKLEEVLITLNIINTIDESIYDIREQSIGTKELLSIREHSTRMFNNERTWITNYGSLGYYLGFITGKNASYLSPSEQSYYSNIALIKLYSNYKDLGEVISNEDKQYDEYIYNYILQVINRQPEVATVIRHLKSLYRYDLSVYGEPYLLTNFKEGQHIDFIFQQLSTNYMYMLKDVYKAIQDNLLTIDEIPLEETNIDTVKTLYDYNEELIGPSGINTLIVLLSSTLIRRAHYLCNTDYINNKDRVEDLINKATSLLQFSPITEEIGNTINNITDTEVETYGNKI